MSQDQSTKPPRSRREYLKGEVNGRFKHGRVRTKEYRAWRNAKERCFNPNTHNYENYGGRGITMSERWKNSFENFLADMGNAPSQSHSIDRIDNDGPYSPENCRWATRREQNTNSRNCLIINGKRVSHGQLAKDHGITQSALQSRLSRGWTLKRSLNTPMLRTHGKRNG